MPITKLNEKFHKGLKGLRRDEEDSDDGDDDDDDDNGGFRVKSIMILEILKKEFGSQYSISELGSSRGSSSMNSSLHLLLTSKPVSTLK